jgi:aldose 1-epimerase
VSLFVAGVDVLAGGGSDDEVLAGDWTAGAICGRVAGRISGARFTLDGIEHRLAANLGEHQLHGGPDNFAIRRWQVKKEAGGLCFALQAPHGDQGYPGALEMTARYGLAGPTLSLELAARTSAPTVVNLTSHAYWNLSGGVRDAFDHELQIEAAAFLPLDDLLLPTGEIREVAGTRWDFRKLRKIGENYDNCWVLEGQRGTLRRGLALSDPVSKRRMEVWTTEPGMQVYTAWHWNENMPGRNGPLRQYAAIAIEPQNFPDAPNHAHFPSAVLRPGEVYRNRIEWHFG